MYEIWKDGKLLGVVMSQDAVWINQRQDGLCYETKRDFAKGIEYAGTVYHLIGYEPMEGCEDVTMVYIDEANYVRWTREGMDKNTVSVTDLETAACEAESMTDQRLTDIETALCEMDAAQNGGI